MVQTAHKDKVPKTGRVFTTMEIEHMLDLEVRLRGERNVARAMLPFLPNKTIKQIRDKRNEQNYKRWKLERLRGSHETSGASGEEETSADGAPSIHDSPSSENRDSGSETELLDLPTSTLLWRMGTIAKVLDLLGQLELPHPADNTVHHIKELLTQSTATR